MDERIFAGVVQLRSTPDIDANLRTALVYTEYAARSGARLVTLPENTPYLGPQEGLLAAAQPLTGSHVQQFQEAARRLGVWILIGSFPECGPDPQHIFNTSVLLDSEGTVRAVYRKIHLFDVETPNGERLHESASVAPGSEVVIAEFGPWRVGLSVCYDLRFPELYRAMSARGVDILCVPAAFTAETGRDHWWALLRARAIENLSYVVAPNQWGVHHGVRRSYGRSVIFDPWGNVLGACPDREGVTLAELDLPSLRETRGRFPCLSHRRPELFG
jgi:predicted amidohydrolase